MGADEYNRSRGYSVALWIRIQTLVRIEADGVPGPATSRAVTVWQAELGLVDDGRVGPQTLHAMAGVWSAVDFNRARHYAPDVWQKVQQLVSGNADGIPGPRTAVLVILWQRAHGGLVADGKVGRMTIAAMQAVWQSGAAEARGVDVSHWQPPIEWNHVAASGYTFAIVKLTEGVGYIDPRAGSHAGGARAAGMAVGWYHYATPKEWDPVEEADAFLEALEVYAQPDLLPVLDLESNAHGLSRERMTEWALSWLARVEASFARKPILYTYPHFAARWLAAGRGLESYPLWIAHYEVAEPTVPSIWPSFDIWQHSATGSVSGISGNCDLNVAPLGIGHLLVAQGDEPGDIEPPPPADSDGGLAFILSLPERPTMEREQRILEAVLAGHIRPIAWRPVDCSRAGHSCTVFVADDALAIGNDVDFVRVSVRHPTAQHIADAIGALLPTTRISDQAWVHADVVLNPKTQVPNSAMANTSRMLAHHRAIENARNGVNGLVRTVGKDWVITNLLEGRPTRSALFGWHAAWGSHSSPGGARVVQPLSVNAHGADYVDYSHTVCLVSRRCIVDGVERNLVDVMTSDTLAILVSDEGPLRTTRHPCAPCARDAAPELLRRVAEPDLGCVSHER